MEARGNTAGTSTGLAPPARTPNDRISTLMAGGPDGNERLTAVTGVLLLVLLAVLGVTIVRIGQLTWLHLFLGLLLIGPVGLKMASTGYRFTRYYTHDPAYQTLAAVNADVFGADKAAGGGQPKKMAATHDPAYQTLAGMDNNVFNR